MPFADPRSSSFNLTSTLQAGRHSITRMKETGSGIIRVWMFILAPILAPSRNKYDHVCQSTIHLAGVQITSSSFLLFSGITFTCCLQKRKMVKEVFTSFWDSVVQDRLSAFTLTFKCLPMQDLLRVC